MKCPDCGNELRTSDLKGITVQECVKCKGKWFERDQLRLAKDRQDDALRWLDFDPFGKDAEKLSVAAEGKTCPRCMNPMAALTYRQSKIVIDKCRTCEGVWLDPGQFVRIIRYLENVVLTESVKGYAKDTFKQFIEIFTGKEGITSEVKDFLAVFYLMELRIAAEHPSLTAASQSISKSTPFS